MITANIAIYWVQLGHSHIILHPYSVGVILFVQHPQLVFVTAILSSITLLLE